MSLAKQQYGGVYPLLLIVLATSFVMSVCFGAVDIAPAEIVSGLRKYFTSGDLSLNERIMLHIRLPRAIMCVIAGASLAVGGTLMQALFRNPIVEPGLIGTSSGAAFGAALYFVLGALWKLDTGPWSLPVAASAGAFLATGLVFVLSKSRQQGNGSIITLLLMGIAINAVFLSGVGFLSYIARDPQARSITFWNLGTLSGSSWPSVLVTSISSVLCIVIALLYSRQLNALMMGEEEALLIGVNVKRLKRNVLLVNVIMIASVTAFIGVISFVGLLVPHLLRIWKGSDNRYLLIGSAIAGGILLSAADLAARLILKPSELPIGIVTSLVGVPAFIFLLRKNKYFF